MPPALPEIARFGVAGLGRRPAWMLATGGLCLCLAFVACSAWFVRLMEEGDTAEAIRAAMIAPGMRTVLRDVAASLPASQAVLMLDANGVMASSEV